MKIDCCENRIGIILWRTSIGRPLLEVRVPISKSRSDNKTFSGKLKEGPLEEDAWTVGSRFDQIPYPVLDQSYSNRIPRAC